MRPAGKAQIVLRRDPAAVAVRHFNAQAMGAPAAALRDGDIHRRLGIVNRTLRNQVERAALRRVVAEIDFEIMIARHALELAAAEAAHGFSVERADQVRDVLAGVIHRARDVVRRCDRGDAKFRRRNHEALVDKNLRAGRMIDRHEREIVVVVDFPQFRGDADIVEAVVRHELVASDLVPLSGGRDLRRAQSVDAQPDGRTPGNRVLHKLHLLSVVGEQERAGRLQALLGHDFLVGLHAKLGAHRAVRPDDPHHLRLGLLAQTEMKLRSGDRLLLHQQAGANFDFAADAEGIDALIANRLHRVRTHHLPVIILRALIHRLHRLSVGRKAEQVEMAVVAQVGGVEDQRRSRRMSSAA